VLLVLSVVACAVGGLSLVTDGALSKTAYGVNVALAVLLAVLTTQDLRRRGLTWQAPLVGVSYVFAPLVGLALYAIASNRPARPAEVTA
jgi:phosphoglycerol transferase MdoB-like AlkP superfamily enzyme